MKKALHRKRQKRYTRKQKREGKHNINVFISNDAYQVLRKYQEKTGLKYGDIVDKALLFFGDSDPDLSQKKPVTQEIILDSDTYDYVLSGLKKRIDQGESYNEILPDLCLLLDDMRKDDIPYQEIADRLNEAGIPKRTKGQWTFKAVTSVYYRCKKDKLTGKD